MTSGDLEYIVAEGRCVAELELAVQQLLDENYKPYGHMVIGKCRNLDGDLEPIFCQPMVPKL